MKTRTLYYTYSDNCGLMCVVSRVRGKGILKSYGEHHGTKLDSVLQHKGFTTDHPDNHLSVFNSTFRGLERASSEADMLPALYEVAKYYNVSERVKLSMDEFFDLLK